MPGLHLPVYFLTLLISLALQGPSPSLGDNIDTSPVALFSSNVSKQFGYQVLQFGEGPDTRIIVGAPGEQNSTGKVYQCNMQSDTCENVPLDGGSGVSHLGMTLASDVRGSKMIACGPGLAEHCDKNLYLSGICYLFDAKLRNPESIKTGYQKCLKGNVDLVFLFDGSESMKNRDFSNITEFMIGVMDGLHNSTVHFAAVQFSSSPKIEFDFNDYTRNPNPRALLKGVTHMKSITNTFKAIRCVVDQVFIPERGMRKGSNKVIIIITDGVASDSDNGVIASAKKKGILRLAIGIGHYFNTEEAQDKLREIASEPTDQFVKVLATFEELRGSFNDLQSKIYAIEGTSDTGSFHLELSSSGLSADISQGRVVLGAVGADNWAGGLLEQQKGLAGEKFITTPSVRKEMEGAYLGYALKFLQHQQRELYAAGAPRYQHVGRVLIFEVNSSTTNWTLKQDIPGQQIGSYFGAVLCSVDVDGDKETDLLLVGAPQYFTEMRGGRVYVYTWKQGTLVHQGELTGDPGYPLGRFGAAITDLSDISGDGLMDVAVGAPSEDEERGAVYIYNGHEKTLQMQYSQRISGARISPGLVFFGQSIHGKRDLNGDGLTDIAVGALGKVVVLRSRPIITVVTKVHSSPKEIPREDVECLGDASTWKNLVVDLSICFSTSLATKHYQGPLSPKLSFRFEIDRNRMRHRGVFKNGTKVTDGVKELSLGEVCIQESILFKSCIEDYISPIKLFMNFSLGRDNNPSNGHPRPVLSPLSNAVTVEIPFDKHCGEDQVCHADLKLSFHNSGSQELVVFPGRDLDMSLELENRKEDAYSVTLHVPHIPGLSFRKAWVSNTLLVMSCDGLLDSQHLKGLSCNISHPVFKSNTKALIQLRFSILSNSSWGDYLEMKANVTSDNNVNETLDTGASHTIPVLYPINIIVKESETSSHYVNFTSQRQENKTVTHSYELTNRPLGAFAPPALSVIVKVPTALPAGLTWEVDNIRTVPSAVCQPMEMEKSTKVQVKLTEQCVTGTYLTYKCDLGQINSSIIHITGLMYTQSKIEKTSQFKFCTALWFTFDTTRYTNFYPTEFAQFQVAEVEMIHVMNYLPVIIGSAVGGLFLLILIIVSLYKCGFFKRNYKEMMDLQENNNAVDLEDNPGGDAEKEAKSNGSEGSDSEKEAKEKTDLLNGEADTK
ncbi:integrin alpha-L isoform X1 [Podarcis raffonei]|uniref:integrin alpha-L isoform X1 n=1 Tax=Podarcis raffonei TaxID=65483 RepID=UPI0023293E60|nr:integrin alpha-L isoform X1 [Podarcis raffonei]